MASPKGLTEEALSAGIVHITVGSKETPFDVHRELLRTNSLYFAHRTILAKEAFNKIQFPEYESDVFADFLSWLYCGKFIEKEGNNASKSPSPTRPERVLHLLQLWKLASNFQIFSLQTLIETCLIEAFHEDKDALVDSKAVEYVYLHATASYSLRNLVVKNWAERGNKQSFIDCNKDFAREFLEDLIKAYMTNSDTTSPPESNKFPGSGWFGGRPAPSTDLTVPPRPTPLFGGTTTSPFGGASRSAFEGKTSLFGTGNYHAEKVTVELRPTSSASFGVANNTTA